MKKSSLLGTLLLATSLAGCGSTTNLVTGAPEPTFLGIGFTTGSAAKDAKLITVGQKIDAGLVTAANIEQQDLPSLCALGAKVQPIALGVDATLPSSTQTKVGIGLGILASALASRSCTTPATGTLTDAVTLAQSIRGITLAIKTPAATIAAK